MGTRTFGSPETEPTNRPQIGRFHLVVLPNEPPEEVEVNGPDEPRPRTRGDCVDGPRPCPWVGCKHNLYLDVGKSGAVAPNFPDREPGELPPEWSCVLDIVDRGGATLEEVGRAMNVTRERARQIEETALNRTLRRARQSALNDFDEGTGARLNSRQTSCASGDAEPAVVEHEPPNEEPRGPVSFFADGDGMELEEQVCDSVWNLLAKRNR